MLNVYVSELYLSILMFKYFWGDAGVKMNYMVRVCAGRQNEYSHNQTVIPRLSGTNAYR